ncbi:MAG: RNA-binding domain-containing protein [Mangrovibacterium sp.]
MALIDEIKKGESKILEFKETLSDKMKIIKTIIAFSNTAGGKLLIGVDDKGTVVGVDDNAVFEMQDTVASIVYDNCAPYISPEIYNVNIDGKIVLVVEVVRGNQKPYYYKAKGRDEGTYFRLGATNRQASMDYIQELERQKRNISYDEEICYDALLSDLDWSVLAKKFDEVGKTLDEEKLQNLKLIKIEAGKIYPTNGLMIILGKFPHCTVKCARFKGKTMEIFTDKKEYSGDVFSILEQTQSFALNHINLKGEILGLYRTDTYEIPVPAIREALINAIIHRDYTNQGRDIKLGIYDDILNIVSPGSLPNNITMEDVFSGRSEARNRVVSNVFKELGLIEQWGTGIGRIISACEAQGIPTPKISEQNDFFDVEIVRQQATDYDRLRPITTDYDRLSQAEKEIVQYLLDKGVISRKDAVELLGVGETKVKEILNALVEKGIIVREGQGRGTYYKL